ncbi:MAG: hypothetical protein JJW01_02525 [Alphaproteobacteria bacterium]|nr:hypothetical protein [Rickettsiales bacterium]
MSNLQSNFLSKFVNLVCLFAFYVLFAFTLSVNVCANSSVRTQKKVIKSLQKLAKNSGPTQQMHTQQIAPSQTVQQAPVENYNQQYNLPNQVDSYQSNDNYRQGQQGYPYNNQYGGANQYGGNNQGGQQNNLYQPTQEGDGNYGQYNNDNANNSSYINNNYDRSTNQGTMNHSRPFQYIRNEPHHYNQEEENGYEKSIKDVSSGYNVGKPNLQERSLDINIDVFIGEFMYKAREMGLNYKIDERPKRKLSQLKDSAVFCLNIKRLCFSVVWERGRENINTIAMVTTGDGTQQSADETINTVHAFVSTITPGLTYDNINNLMTRMGILGDAEIGSGFIIKPNGRQVRYEHARSTKAGLVIIASPIK